MPILDYLIPQYISVDVSSNIESNALPIGYNIYFSTKEEFRLKVISHEKFKLTAIYFDNNIKEYNEYQTANNLTYSVKEYKTKKKFIDYNEDGVFDGKEEIDVENNNTETETK